MYFDLITNKVHFTKPHTKQPKTLCLKTKHPKTKRHKTKRPTDKTSQGAKRPKGQNVPLAITSQRINEADYIIRVANYLIQ